ncbi:MAG: ABC transporter ATP-binding protein [Streptomyces sp.]|nr:ABC transporter ATP-binding protein [Streptomyces sp.]NUT24600.1 ABC transporter ATP-binding protein [Streptomyces sp.]
MIHVDSATVRYGDRAALTDASLSVAPGEFLCLVGRNGSGKTTLLRLLAGLLEPTAGTVRIGGRAAADRQSRAVRGFLQAEPPLYEYLTVAEQLALVAKLYGRPPAQVLDRLAGTALADRRHALVRELSLGMRKQLGLIAATVHDPALILLDEPTNALDATAVAALRETVERWHGEGRLIVLCTHDLAWADGLADRLVVLSAGRVLHDVALDGETATAALRRLDPSGALTARSEGSTEESVEGPTDPPTDQPTEENTAEAGTP